MINWIYQAGEFAKFRTFLVVATNITGASTGASTGSSTGGRTNYTSRKLINKLFFTILKKIAFLKYILYNVMPSNLTIFTKICGRLVYINTITVLEFQ